MKTAGRSILIFGGTTEGRNAAEGLLAAGVPCTVSVATHYGEEVLTPHPLMTVHAGRLDRSGMAQLMREGSFSCVIDATHPHAQIVSGEIGAACRETGLPYLHLQRDVLTGNASDSPEDHASLGDDDFVYVSDADQAGAFLASVQGHILVTTGSKELVRFAKALGDPSRITARVLPTQESLQACAEAGLAGKQIFAMQGPFDVEMNCAQIHYAGASWLLTKETGAAGGFPEKTEAVRRCGIRAVVIRTPAENLAQTLDLEHTITEALRYAGVDADSDTYHGAGDGVSADKNVTANEDAAVKGFLSGVTAMEDVSIKGGFSDMSNMPAMEESAVMAGLSDVAAMEDSAVMAGLSDVAVMDGEAVMGGITITEDVDDEVYTADMDCEKKRKLFLVGIGVGGAGAVTKEAEEAIATAEVLFGAKTVLDNLMAACESVSSKTIIPAYDSLTIVRYMFENKEIERAAAVYSGDSGFYSGAARLYSPLNRRPMYDRGIEMQLICGISCVSWFASRAGIPWQDWKILSSHGRYCNVVGQVRRNRECFLLLSGAKDLRWTGVMLARAQKQGVLGELQLIYGYELSRPAEKICTCTAHELTEVKGEGLYVLYIKHLDAENCPVVPGLPDDAFIRGKAPMTSSEIRSLSLCRLGLTSEAVLWDVGAGTGSVSIEAALTCPEGKILSIEYKQDALALLEQNRAKYCLQNMEIVQGRAPEALSDLPEPTHVFIGGSGGEIGDILKEVFSRNSEARVVVNCITSETLAALKTALKELVVRDLQCTQVIVNREEMLGHYHYLRAGNPVFIISFTGSESYIV